MGSEIFKKILENVPAETKAEVHLSMKIAVRIADLMQQKNLTKSEFARQLGKDPAEITRWLSGMHTFTTKTLGKLELFFDKPILIVPHSFDESVSTSMSNIV
jgi:transcriptional regulator with XRE-family HTH domain